MDLITFLLLFIIWLILFYYRISSCFCFWFIWWVEDLKNPMNNSPHEVGIWRIPGGDGTQALLCNITWCSIIFLLTYKKKGGMTLGNKVFQIKITREKSDLESRPKLLVYPSLCKWLSWYIWFKLTIYFWCPMYIWILCWKHFISLPDTAAKSNWL